MVLVVRSPSALLAVALVSLAFQLLGALAYLIVLPEELDASFNKALPMLVEGEYIHEPHVQPVRQVLPERRTKVENPGVMVIKADRIMTG